MCVKYRKYKTSKATAKSYLEGAGAIDQYNNIIDQGLFNMYQSKFNRVAKEKYSLTEDVILRNDVPGDTNNAIFNLSAFHQIDAAKGVYYTENSHLQKQEQEKEEQYNKYKESPNTSLSKEEFMSLSQKQIDKILSCL